MKKSKQAKSTASSELIAKIKDRPVVPDKGEDGKPNLVKLAVDLARKNFESRE